ncbi:MAG TPA: sigma-70 family RNA polymerase sigma factor [Actinomycetota bacterium]|nr:sigma-70 family RNA polymerase sigma factor [Actinomycetota bacterium]
MDRTPPSGHAEFESFYAASFGRLVGQLALVTGDLHEAEDLAQEAFARASTRWARLRDYDVPEAWVRRVALRLAANTARQGRRRAAALLRVGPAPATPAASADAIAVDIALRALPIRYRQVVVLHYLLGLRVEEVARELAIPAGTVKARLFRARRALASKLAEPIPEPEVHHPHEEPHRAP